MSDQSAWAAGTQTDPANACPIGPVVDIVFSRWTTPILWALNEYGRLRFVELQRVLPGISTEQLRSRLNRMVADGLLTRQRYREVPPRVDYELTALGTSLVPVMESLRHWSEDHIEEILAARDDYDTARPGSSGD